MEEFDDVCEVQIPYSLYKQLLDSAPDAQITLMARYNKRKAEEIRFLYKQIAILKQKK